MLSEDEYISARESTPNAHYTPAILIKAMYKVFENLGFENGNILEPSMGIGNFFSHIPQLKQVYYIITKKERKFFF